MGWGSVNSDIVTLAEALTSAVDRYLMDPTDLNRHLLQAANRRVKQTHPDWLRTEL